MKKRPLRAEREAPRHGQYAARAATGIHVIGNSSIILRAWNKIQTDFDLIGILDSMFQFLHFALCQFAVPKVYVYPWVFYGFGRRGRVFEANLALAFRDVPRAAADLAPR
jgi:hypothetical protein